MPPDHTGTQRTPRTPLDRRLPRHLTLTCVLAAVNTLAAADLRDVDKYLGQEWLGVYMQGKKVGYAQAISEKSTLNGQPAYRFAMRMLTKVNLMGTVQETTIEEVKHFSVAGKFLAFTTRMRSTMNAVPIANTHIEGRVKGDKLNITTTTGTAKTQSTLDAPEETLDDYLAANRLAEHGSKIGDEITVKVFEGSLMRTLAARLKVTAKRTILFNGIETKVTEIEMLIPDLGVTTTSYVDPEGRMIETRVAGLFVLRAETEAQAKDVKFAFDAVRSSVVVIDKPIAHSFETKRMVVEVTGLTNPKVALNTSRQTCRQLAPGRYRIETKVEDVSDLKPLPLPVTDPQFADDLKATPLLQCDHPKIKAKAAEILGHTKHAWPAAKRLSAWVWSELDKVGTVALSNAVETLESKQGDCTEHTALFVALARAAGIPARPCTGLIYWEQARGFGYHQWAKVYVGKWVEIDPTFHQPVADATHIKFAEGDWAQAARILSIVGQIQIRVIETE